MRGFALTGTAATIVALRTTVRDRRARLWLVIVDAWTRTVLASDEGPEAVRPMLRHLARVFERTVERARFDGDAVDDARARAWRDALSVDEGPLSPSGAARVWAISCEDADAAAAMYRAARGVR